MVSLGLSLTLDQVIARLRDARLVVMGLIANFVIAPAAAWGVAEVLGLDQSLTLGLLLLDTAAGALKPPPERLARSIPLAICSMELDSVYFEL